MKNQKTVSNLFVASVLVVVVTTFGLFANFKIQADSYPGYASAKLQFKIKSATKQNIEVEARFMSTNPTVKKYNYKKRTFTVKAGTTSINWTIRKIIPGAKLVKIYANKTFFPDEYITTMQADEISIVGPFQWIDPTITPTPKPTVTSTPNVSKTQSAIPIPAVPVAPSPTTTATSTSGDYLSLPGGL